MSIIYMQNAKITAAAPQTSAQCQIFLDGYDMKDLDDIVVQFQILMAAQTVGTSLLSLPKVCPLFLFFFPLLV